MFKRTEKQSRLIAVCFILAFVLLLSGCGAWGGGERKLPSRDTGTGPRIALITGENGIEDPCYRKAWAGLEQAERELGATIGFVKVKSEKEFPSKLNELRSQKSQIIVTVGPEGAASVIEAAKENPSIKYICLNSHIEGTVPANVLGVTYKVEEAAFLAGYLAGKMTKSNVIGFISGSNEDEYLRYFYGYKAGIRYANSNCELMKGLAGTFTNKSRVEKVALRMIEVQADVIFHVAGTAGKGMINAMERTGKYAIGSLFDESGTAPNNVLASVIINHDQVLMDIFKQYQKKKLVLGKNVIHGLADEGVAITEATNSLIPKNIDDAMTKHRDNIIAGKLTIPANENDYYKFAK